MMKRTSTSAWNRAMLAGVLVLLYSFFDQLADLQSLRELAQPRILGAFGTRLIGAALAIVGAWHGGASKDTAGHISEKWLASRGR
jgi:hypothetical protein